MEVQVASEFTQEIQLRMNGEETGQKLSKLMLHHALQLVQS